LDGIPLTPAGTPNTALLPQPLDPAERLVAETYASQGRAAVVVMKTFGKGQVVTMGSIGWVRALMDGDPVVTRITDNAFNLLR
jgi:hypothetical protein